MAATALERKDQNDDRLLLRMPLLADETPSSGWDRRSPRSLGLGASPDQDHHGFHIPASAKNSNPYIRQPHLIRPAICAQGNVVAAP
jgi:hypothetical protein